MGQVCMRQWQTSLDLAILKLVIPNVWRQQKPSDARTCVFAGLGASDASRQNGCGNGAAASPCANGSTRAQVACQADATADVPPTEEDAAEVCAKQDGAGAAGETHLLDVDPGEVHVPESVLDAWILESLDEPDTRTARVDYLVAAARPLRYEHAEVLMTMGNVYDRNVE